MRAVSDRYPLTPVRNHPGIYSYEVRKGPPKQRRRYQAVATVKGKQRWSGGHKTIAAAEQALEDLRRSLSGGATAADVHLTVNDFLEQHWLPSVEVSAGSERAYKQRIGRVKDSPLDGMRLIDVTEAHIEAYKVHLRSQGLAPSTRHAAFTVLVQAFDYARRRKLIAASPCIDVKAPPRGRHRVPVLDEQTIAKLLAAADTEGYGCLIWLAIDTGLREQKEAFNLLWSDIDFHAGILRVPDSKTPSGERAIAIGAESARRLQQHRIEQLRRFNQVLGAPPPPHVFVSPRGLKMTQAILWPAWNRIRITAGVPELHFHDLRHVHSTVLARMGVPAAVAKERMGHASAKTTLDIYTQTTTRDQEQAADALASWLGLSG